jgi:hypothetical protein
MKYLMKYLMLKYYFKYYVNIYYIFISLHNHFSLFAMSFNLLYGILNTIVDILCGLILTNANLSINSFFIL